MSQPERREHGLKEQRHEPCRAVAPPGPNLNTEDTIKYALVLPLLQLLGYTPSLWKLTLELPRNTRRSDCRAAP